MQEAVEGVGKVQLSITGVDDNVVERVELAAKIIVEEDFESVSFEYMCLEKPNLPVVLNGSTGFIRNIVEVMSAPWPSPAKTMLPL